MSNQYKIRRITCLGCGRVVIKRLRPNQKYCSLRCWQSSVHPQRKTGAMVTCEYCGKNKYKPKGQLRYGHHFCSLACANRYQAKNKLSFYCKICGKQFYWSPSRIKNNNPTYCSVQCRRQDKKRLQEIGIQANLIQQSKKGLNKLEQEGRAILQGVGVRFQEQILMFDKFLVDAIIPDKKLIIQWDGQYWHSRPQRKKLDKSQDAYFNKCGYKVLRFSDNDVFKNKGYVIENIQRAI